MAHKTLKILQKHKNKNIQKQIKFYQKKIWSKIIFKKLYLNYKKQKEKYEFYRKKHLKKYYFYRLIRTIKFLQNLKIANLKFLFKIFYLWKKAVLICKNQKKQSTFKLYYILISLQFKSKKLFFIKFKKHLLKLHKLKLKAFLSLKYYRLYKIIKGKKNFLIVQKCFKAIKFFRDISIPLSIKEEEADKKYKKRLYNVYIKNYIKKLKNSINLNKKISQEILKIRLFFRIGNIFNFLKKNAYNSKKYYDKIIYRSRKYFLLYNFFNLLKTHTLIVYREKKILYEVERRFLIKQKELQSLCFYFLFLNRAYEKTKKKHELNYKIKVFYSLKMLSNKNFINENYDY